MKDAWINEAKFKLLYWVKTCNSIWKDHLTSFSICIMFNTNSSLIKISATGAKKLSSDKILVENRLTNKTSWVSKGIILFTIPNSYKVCAFSSNLEAYLSNAESAWNNYNYIKFKPHPFFQRRNDVLMSYIQSFKL